MYKFMNLRNLERNKTRSLKSQLKFTFNTNCLCINKKLLIMLILRFLENKASDKFVSEIRMLDLEDRVAETWKGSLRHGDDIDWLGGHSANQEQEAETSCVCVCTKRVCVSLKYRRCVL